MANPPSEPNRLQFIIKKYGQGVLLPAGRRLEGWRQPDAARSLRHLLAAREPHRALVLVGGGSGMSPMWSILHDHIASGEPARPIHFFYGARQARDLFYLDRFAELAEKLPDFQFIPALSDAAPEDAWTGSAASSMKSSGAHLPDMGDAADIDVYACGPPPMIDALLPVLQIAGVEPERIFFDKFTPLFDSSPK